MSKELINKILEASKVIHSQSLRGGANYIVTSPHISNVLSNTLRCIDRKIKIKRIFNEEI
jgi:hypothetical protein